MPKFSAKSLKMLATCHPDIQKVMHEAIKHIDFTIIYGERSVAEQFKLFKIGRKLVKGQWVVVGKVVTNMDGTIKRGKHNFSPSKAIDIGPYPLDWNDIQAFKDLAVVIKKAMVTVGVQLQWGGDWKNFIDFPHYELK
jgi:peptidoglycan L-alanyl-D-glutamate endopeptidase CwlK